jgi:hypothetical protein
MLGYVGYDSSTMINLKKWIVEYKQMMGLVGPLVNSGRFKSSVHGPGADSVVSGRAAFFQGTQK